MFGFRKNAVTSKSNSGISLVGILIGLGLLTLFIMMSSTVFKNFYTNKKTISEAQKALDVTGNIIYDVFGSIGTLADNLGRGNCQNLNFEDILTDIYGECKCETKTDTCTCDKADESKRTFFIPIVGMQKYFNNTTSSKFQSIYNRRPQTEDELSGKDGNGMPEEVVKRCSNSELLSILDETIVQMTDEEKQKMEETYEKLPIYQEYFNLIMNLFKEEVRFSSIYHQVTSIKMDNDFSTRFDTDTQNNIEEALKILNNYKYFEPRSTLKLMEPSDFVILCKSISIQNQNENIFVCNDYSFELSTLNKIINNINNNEYVKLIDALTQIKNIYEGITDPTEKETKTLNNVKDLIRVFSSETITQEDTTQINPYDYFSKIKKLSELNTTIATDTELNKYVQENFKKDIATYNKGEDPFEEGYNLDTLFEKGRYCGKKYIHTCFNIQDNNSGLDLLSGTNPTSVKDTNDKTLDCYNADVNHPKCKDRSSIILEVKAYPMLIDDKDSPNEVNIPFFKYNDSGSFNRLLKMVYTLHWTKKIDGKYKYFKLVSSFTMSTSSNLRQ